MFDSNQKRATRQGRLQEWMLEIYEIVDEGRALQRELQQAIDDALPREDWMIKDLWRSSLQLMEFILEGIYTLEVRLDLTNPYPPSD